MQYGDRSIGGCGSVCTLKEAEGKAGEAIGCANRSGQAITWWLGGQLRGEAVRAYFLLSILSLTHDDWD